MQDSAFSEAYYLLIFIVIPIAAIWVYFDATKRAKTTKEAILWAIGTLLFSIIVLPIWFWSRPNFELENEYMCPECKEVYQGKKVVCPFCGYLLPGDEIVDLSSDKPLNGKEPPPSNYNKGT
jgi:hypothetical protein